MPRRIFNVLAKNLKDIMMESLPKLVDEHIKKILQSQVPLHVAQGIILEREKSQAYVSKMIAEAIQQECSIPVKDIIPLAQEQQYQLYLTMKDDPQLQKDNISIWLALKIKFERLQGRIVQRGPSTLGNHEQSDDFDYWTDSYAIYDDVFPNEKASQELVDEIAQTVDEANCRRDHKALALSLVNQDLLYLKKGNSGPKKIALSLHKFPTVIFPDDDIEERTSRWIVQIIKTYWELGHEHKFITKIVVRRAKGGIVSITELDYMNLKKNDIEDMYLLIINKKVDDYDKTKLLWSLFVIIRSIVIWERIHDFQLGVESYQHKVNLTTLTISFPGIEKYKFCDATLKRVLEGLKSYNNDVKHGYVSLSLSKEDVEYLQLFEEEIEEWLKHHDQIRCWEMYVNGRP
ncbi:hypothetical protein Tco_0370855 [Tanacetum coccineum]